MLWDKTANETSRPNVRFVSGVAAEEVITEYSIYVTYFALRHNPPPDDCYKEGILFGGWLLSVINFFGPYPNASACSQHLKLA